MSNKWVTFYVIVIFRFSTWENMSAVLLHQLVPRSVHDSGDIQQVNATRLAFRTIFSRFVAYLMAIFRHFLAFFRPFFVSDCIRIFRAVHFPGEKWLNPSVILCASQKCWTSDVRWLLSAEWVFVREEYLNSWMANWADFIRFIVWG